MSVLQAILLGIVQGATEFIPVSSSAHLVLVPWLLGWHFEPQAAFAFDVLVQLGTLVAVLAMFWRDWSGILRSAVGGLIARRPAEGRLAWLLLLATLPAAVAGVLFKDAVEQAFASPASAAAFLLVTAGLLAASELLHRRQGAPATHSAGRDPLERLGWGDALVIGLAQALALFPGISRSGATIAAGLARGTNRPQAARFSFLMALPIMLGAGLVASLDLRALSQARQLLPALTAGFAAAALVGALAIRWLLRYLARRSLWVFVGYCTLAGLASLAVGQSRTRLAMSEPAIPPPLPRIAATPALEAWASQQVLSFREAQSADGVTGLGFILDTLPPQAALEAAESGETVLAIIGQDPPDDWFATPLGHLGIAIVVDRANPVRDLSLLDLREMFAGRSQVWDSADDLAVQPVVPLAGDELRTAVQQRVLKGDRYAPSALLAPSPPAMATLVADHPGSLGMLPLPEITDAVRAVRVEGQPPGDSGDRYPLRLQIVATAPQEPTGAVRAWLGWLQAELASSAP